MSRITNKQIMEMMEQMMGTMKELKSDYAALRADIDEVKAAQNAPKKPAKKSQPKAAPAKAEKSKKPATRREAIDEWCQKKGYSEADRKAFGEAKRAERELQNKAYEMTNAQFTEKVEYKVWRAQYEANLVALKAAK